jgi:hypothetical protein
LLRDNAAFDQSIAFLDFGLVAETFGCKGPPYIASNHSFWETRMVEFVHRGFCVNYHHQYVYEPFFGLDCELCAERVLALNLN